MPWPRYCGASAADSLLAIGERDLGNDITCSCEPEGRGVDEIYVNGLSMSLPIDVQLEIVHSLPGLERAEMLRPAYAVEYDFIQPTELRASLERSGCAGCTLPAQINGTSGYEEAAGQGLLAGINAAGR